MNGKRETFDLYAVVYPGDHSVPGITVMEIGVHPY